MQSREESQVSIGDGLVGLGLVIAVIAVGAIAGVGTLRLGWAMWPATIVGLVAAGLAAFAIAFFAPKSLGRGVSAFVALLGAFNF